MSEQENKKGTMKKESGMHGKKYEREILALIGVKCILDDTIKDFWMMSNPKEINKFDDVILFVEYEDNSKELFLIQAKHSFEARKLLPHRFQTPKDKHFYLPPYSSAFTEITKDEKSFLKNNEIGEVVKKYFIIFTNRKLEFISRKSLEQEDKSNENLDYDLRFCEYPKANINTFINTQGNIYSVRKTNISEDISEDFLNHFLLYDDQINWDNICMEINKLLDLPLADGIIQCIYNFADPDNPEKKLTKANFKRKILELIFGEYRPYPLISANSLSYEIIMKTLSSVNVTIISKQFSERIIWNSVFQKMRTEYPEQMSACWGNQQKQIFLEMVVKSELPFFIKNDNNYFDNFCCILLPKLKIYTVAFSYENTHLEFPPNMKVFRNVDDLSTEVICMNKKIELSFRGKTSFDLCNVLMDPHAQQIRKQISTDMFFKLLEGFKLEIGKKYELPQYYINRRINFQFLDINKIIELKTGLLNTWLFILYNLPTKYEIMIDRDGDNIILNNETLEEYNIIRTNEPFSMDLMKEYLEIISISEDIAIFSHISTNGFSGFRLIYTNKTIDIFKPYLSQRELIDKDLLNVFGAMPVNIICNNAGMGKSMILHYIERCYPSDIWVVHVDLWEYEKLISDIHTTTQLCDFFFDAHKQVDGLSEFSELFSSIYKYYLKKRKLVWLIDDYEEIHNLKFLTLLNDASQEGIRIWLVGRPSTQPKFEYVFKIFAMELAELSKLEQIVFFKKYLDYEKIIKTDDEIRNAIDKIKTLFEDSFIGVCQQTKMLADIFIRGIDLNENYRIEDIYEKFIEIQVNYNLNKYKNIDESNESIEIYKNKELANLSKIALYHFYSKKILRTVFDWDEFMWDLNIFKTEYKKHNLIIGYKKQNIPIFSHSTYAEFLAARWLMNVTQKQIAKKTSYDIRKLVKTLYYTELTNIRIFFDNMITRPASIFPYIINNKYDKMPPKYNHLRIFPEDNLGRTIVHMIMSYGIIHYDIHPKGEILKVLQTIDKENCHATVRKRRSLIKLNDIPQPTSKGDHRIHRQLLSQITQSDILETDTFLGMNGIEFALSSGSLMELDNILSTAQIFLPLDEYINRDQSYLLIYHCIKHNFNAILKCLRGLDLKRLNCHKVRDAENSSSLLHLAIISQNIEAINTLLVLEDLEEWGKDNEGNTPLHLACKYKEISDIFYDYFKTNNIPIYYLNYANKMGRTVLHNLVYYGRVQWVVSLVEIKDINTNVQCAKGNTPFMLSIMTDRLEIANELKVVKSNGINYSNKLGMTALHYAATKGYYKCCKFLLNQGADVNCPQQDKYGKTPLMMASRVNRVGIVNLLIKNGANVNVKDQSGRTALHHAVEYKISKAVIKVLCKNGAEILKNRRQETPIDVCKRLHVKDSIIVELTKQLEFITINRRYDNVPFLLFQRGTN